MNDFVSGILSRTDDAFYALLLMIAFQAVVMLLSFATQKTFLVRPLAEIWLRPFIIFLTDRLNRPDRSDFALIVRGAIVFFLILAVITGVGIALEHFIVLSGLGAFMDVIMLALVLSPLAVILPAYSISKVSPKEGRYKQVAIALNQNLIGRDEYGLRRASVHLYAMAFIDWVVGPVAFYLIGGMPFVCLYVALSLFVRIDSTFNAKFLNVFGFIYKILQGVGSILAVIITLFASCFASGGRPLNIFSAIQKHGLNMDSALAYSQRLTIGGAIQNRKGQNIKGPWIGPEGSTAKIEQRDIIRVTIQYCIMVFLLLVAVFALYAFA